MYVGIDPGIRKCGFAVLDTYKNICEAGVIHQYDSDDDIGRLGEIEKTITDLFARYPPKVCTVEQLFFTDKNKKKAGLIYAIRYLILLRAKQAGAILYEVNPITLKKTITGNGKANKTLMTQMIVRMFGLNNIPQYADAVDAIGLALMSRTQRSKTKI